MNDPYNPFEKWTIPGRLLAIGSVAFFAASLSFFMLWILPRLGPGRYPLFVFVIPILLLSALFFGLGVLVFRAVGLRLFKKEAQDITEQKETESTDG